MSKQSRNLRLRWCEPQGRYGVVHVESTEAADYFFLQLAYSKRGRAWALARLMPGVGTIEEMTACLGDEDSPPFCTCEAFRRDGPCDHLDAMRRLLEAGRVA